MMRHLVLPGVFVIATLIGCEAREDSDTSATARDPVAVAKDTDKEAADSLAKSKIDAKQWLASDKHGTFEATKADIVKFTNDCLAAGAVGVWVSAPEELEGKELVSAVFVEMPTDPAKRAKLLEIYNKTEEGQTSPEKDLGQKFVVYEWD